MEEISEILELVRLADMTGVTGIDDAMSERLRLIFASSTPPLRRQDIDLQYGSGSSTAATWGSHIDDLPFPQQLFPTDADSQRSGLPSLAYPSSYVANRLRARSFTQEHPQSSADADSQRSELPFFDPFFIQEAKKRRTKEFYTGAPTIFR